MAQLSAFLYQSDQSKGENSAIESERFDITVYNKRFEKSGRFEM